MLRRALSWGTFVSVLAALYLALIYAPTERVMGDIQRIFYFHVAVAWNAFLAFFVVFICSVLYLRKGERRWDTYAFSAAEIGVLFTTLVLVTGPIWGKAFWGAWWTWDPRLTTTLILWFIYIAYLVIRSSAEGENQARFAAIFGIIGFIDVPIVFMSVRWWRSIHPNLMSEGGMNLEPTMMVAMLASVIAFTLMFFYLLYERVSIEMASEEIRRLKEKLSPR